MEAFGRECLINFKKDREKKKKKKKHREPKQPHFEDWDEIAPSDPRWRPHT